MSEMEYPYLKLVEDTYWVVRSESYIEGFFKLKYDLLEDEFSRTIPKVEDWRKRLYQHELNWGRKKQVLIFDALCGKLLAEDRVVVAAPGETLLPLNAPNAVTPKS